MTPSPKKPSRVNGELMEARELPERSGISAFSLLIGGHIIHLKPQKF